MFVVFDMRDKNGDQGDVGKSLRFFSISHTVVLSVVLNLFWVSVVFNFCFLRIGHCNSVPFSVGCKNGKVAFSVPINLQQNSLVLRIIKITNRCWNGING